MLLIILPNQELLILFNRFFFESFSHFLPFPSPKSTNQPQTQLIYMPKISFQRQPQEINSQQGPKNAEIFLPENSKTNFPSFIFYHWFFFSFFICISLFLKVEEKQNSMETIFFSSCIQNWGWQEAVPKTWKREVGLRWEVLVWKRGSEHLKFGQEWLFTSSIVLLLLIHYVIQIFHQLINLSLFLSRVLNDNYAWVSERKFWEG